MPRSPDKKCPRCGNVLVRIYSRTFKGNNYQSTPIGFMCPVCRENMFVLDKVV